MNSPLARAFCGSILVLVTTHASAQTPNTTAQAPNKGTQIGQIISGAIDTALPGISKLTSAVVDIFKPKPADVPAKTTAVTKVVDTTQSTFKSQIKDQFKGVEPLAVQLDTLGPFLEYGFRASTELSKLLVMVSSTPNPTAAQFLTTKAQWSKVKGALAAISITPVDIQKKVISDNLQQLLLQILEARDVTVGAVDVLLSSKPDAGFPKDLTNELAELNSALATIHVVSRIQLNSMSTEVHTLVAWANTASTSTPTAQGTTKPTPQAIQDDQNAALTLLKRASAKR
jgi:hypothetical protein